MQALCQPNGNGNGLQKRVSLLSVEGLILSCLAREGGTKAAVGGSLLFLRELGIFEYRLLDN